MAAITSAALWHQIPELSRAKRLSSLFRTQKLPRKQKRPEDSSGRTFLQEKVYHSRQIFPVNELLSLAKPLDCCAVLRAQKSQIVQVASLQNRVP
jgi:hypothetical protein